MRLSLWQQFSSNHSAGFDLVGQFKTAEDAQKAYDIVWAFILKIAAYYHEHPEWLEKVHENYLMWLTPVEEELAKQYDLKNWEYSVDWADAAYDEPQMYNGLSIYEELLFLNEFTDTWLYAAPFDELFEKLGAKIQYKANGFDGKYPVVDMSCEAQNVGLATSIVGDLSSSETFQDDTLVSLIKLPDARQYRGIVSHDGLTITFTGLPTSWYPLDITEFLPKLITYLKENSCTNFEFSISSKSDD